MLPELETLHAAAVHLLEARSLFDIDAYGWLNEDDMDPEFVGYAMWTLTPPYEHDFNGLFDGLPAQPGPTDAQQRLLEWGHDFFGLMKVARHFLGLALVTQSSAEEITFEPTEFDANEFAALVSLVSAADRLRDFIIVSVFGRKTDDREEFNKAVAAIREAGMERDAEGLRRWPDAIRRVRDARNTAAHGLAATPARVQRRLFEAVADRSLGNATASSRHTRFELSGSPQEARSALEKRMTLLCNCYRELVQMGNACFLAEYEWRTRAAKIPPPDEPGASDSAASR
jgi:hypothetical protein